MLLRWEEDEFLILLPECSLESAQKIGHLIKSIIESKTFVNMKAILNYAITIHENDDTPDSFTARMEDVLKSEAAA